MLFELLFVYDKDDVPDGVSGLQTIGTAATV